MKFKLKWLTKASALFLSITLALPAPVYSARGLGAKLSTARSELRNELEQLGFVTTEGRLQNAGRAGLLTADRLRPTAASGQVPAKLTPPQGVSVAERSEVRNFVDAFLKSNKGGKQAIQGLMQAKAYDQLKILAEHKEVKDDLREAAFDALIEARAIPQLRQLVENRNFDHSRRYNAFEALLGAHAFEVLRTFIENETLEPFFRLKAIIELASAAPKQLKVVSPVIYTQIFMSKPKDSIAADQFLDAVTSLAGLKDKRINEMLRGLRSEMRKESLKAYIEGRIKDILVEQLTVEPNSVIPKAKLIEDLGADSLDTVEIIMELEEEFGLRIEDEDAEKILGTVGDLNKYVLEKVAPIIKEVLKTTAALWKTKPSSLSLTTAVRSQPDEIRRLRNVMQERFKLGTLHSTQTANWKTLADVARLVQQRQSRSEVRNTSAPVSPSTPFGMVSLSNHQLASLPVSETRAQVHRPTGTPAYSNRSEVRASESYWNQIRLYDHVGYGEHSFRTLNGLRGVAEEKSDVYFLNYLRAEGIQGIYISPFVDGAYGRGDQIRGWIRNGFKNPEQYGLAISRDGATLKIESTNEPTPFLGFQGLDSALSTGKIVLPANKQLGFKGIFMRPIKDWKTRLRVTMHAQHSDQIWNSDSHAISIGNEQILSDGRASYAMQVQVLSKFFTLSVSSNSGVNLDWLGKNIRVVSGEEMELSRQVVMDRNSILPAVDKSGEQSRDGMSLSYETLQAIPKIHFKDDRQGWYPQFDGFTSLIIQLPSSIPVEPRFQQNSDFLAVFYYGNRQGVWQSKDWYAYEPLGEGKYRFYFQVPADAAEYKIAVTVFPTLPIKSGDVQTIPLEHWLAGDNIRIARSEVRKQMAGSRSVDVRAEQGERISGESVSSADLSKTESKWPHTGTLQTQRLPSHASSEVSSGVVNQPNSSMPSSKAQRTVRVQGPNRANRSVVMEAGTRMVNTFKKVWPSTFRRFIPNRDRISDDRLYINLLFVNKISLGQSFLVASLLANGQTRSRGRSEVRLGDEQLSIFVKALETAIPLTGGLGVGIPMLIVGWIAFLQVRDEIKSAVRILKSDLPWRQKIDIIFWDAPETTQTGTTASNFSRSEVRANTVRREDVGSGTNRNVLRHAYRQAGPDIQRPTDSARAEMRMTKGEERDQKTADALIAILAEGYGRLRRELKVFVPRYLIGTDKFIDVMTALKHRQKFSEQELYEFALPIFVLAKIEKERLLADGAPLSTVEIYAAHDFLRGQKTFQEAFQELVQRTQDPQAALRLFMRAKRLHEMRVAELKVARFENVGLHIKTMPQLPEPFSKWPDWLEGFGIESITLSQDRGKPDSITVRIDTNAPQNYFSERNDFVHVPKSVVQAWDQAWQSAGIARIPGFERMQDNQNGTFSYWFTFPAESFSAGKTELGLLIRGTGIQGWLPAGFPNMKVDVPGSGAHLASDKPWRVKMMLNGNYLHAQALAEAARDFIANVSIYDVYSDLGLPTPFGEYFTGEMELSYVQKTPQAERFLGRVRANQSVYEWRPIEIERIKKTKSDPAKLAHDMEGIERPGLRFTSDILGTNDYYLYTLRKPTLRSEARSTHFVRSALRLASAKPNFRSGGAGRAQDSGEQGRTRQVQTTLKLNGPVSFLGHQITLTSVEAPEGGAKKAHLSLVAPAEGDAEPKTGTVTVAEGEAFNSPSNMQDLARVVQIGSDSITLEAFPARIVGGGVWNLAGVGSLVLSAVNQGKAAVLSLVQHKASEDPRENVFDTIQTWELQEGKIIALPFQPRIGKYQHYRVKSIDPRANRVELTYLYDAEVATRRFVEVRGPEAKATDPVAIAWGLMLAPLVAALEFVQRHKGEFSAEVRPVLDAIEDNLRQGIGLLSESPLESAFDAFVKVRTSWRALPEAVREKLAPLYFGEIFIWVDLYKKPAAPFADKLMATPWIPGNSKELQEAVENTLISAMLDREENSPKSRFEEHERTLKRLLVLADSTGGAAAKELWQIVQDADVLKKWVVRKDLNDKIRTLSASLELAKTKPFPWEEENRSVRRPASDEDARQIVRGIIIQYLRGESLGASMDAIEQFIVFEHLTELEHDSIGIYRWMEKSKAATLGMPLVIPGKIENLIRQLVLKPEAETGLIFKIPQPAFGLPLVAPRSEVRQPISEFGLRNAESNNHSAIYTQQSALEARSEARSAVNPVKRPANIKSAKRQVRALGDVFFKYYSRGIRKEKTGEFQRVLDTTDRWYSLSDFFGPDPVVVKITDLFQSHPKSKAQRAEFLALVRQLTLKPISETGKISRGGPVPSMGLPYGTKARSKMRSEAREQITDSSSQIADNRTVSRLPSADWRLPSDRRSEVRTLKVHNPFHKEVRLSFDEGIKLLQKSLTAGKPHSLYADMVTLMDEGDHAIDVKLEQGQILILSSGDEWKPFTGLKNDIFIVDANGDMGYFILYARVMKLKAIREWLQDLPVVSAKQFDSDAALKAPALARAEVRKTDEIISSVELSSGTVQWFSAKSISFADLAKEGSTWNPLVLQSRGQSITTPLNGNVTRSVPVTPVTQRVIHPDDKTSYAELPVEARAMVAAYVAKSEDKVLIITLGVGAGFIVLPNGTAYSLKGYAIDVTAPYTENQGNTGLLSLIRREIARMSAARDTQPGKSTDINPQTTDAVRREDVGSGTNRNGLRHAYRQAGPDIQRPAVSVQRKNERADAIRSALVNEPMFPPRAKDTFFLKWDSKIEVSEIAISQGELNLRLRQYAPSMDDKTNLAQLNVLMRDGKLTLSWAFPHGIGMNLMVAHLPALRKTLEPAARQAGLEWNDETRSDPNGGVRSEARNTSAPVSQFTRLPVSETHAQAHRPTGSLVNSHRSEARTSRPDVMTTHISEIQTVSSGSKFAAPKKTMPAQLAGLGFNSRASKWSNDFSKQRYRTFNFADASKAFQGGQLKPGQVFAVVLANKKSVTGKLVSVDSNKLQLQVKGVRISFSSTDIHTVRPVYRAEVRAKAADTEEVTTTIPSFVRRLQSGKPASMFIDHTPAGKPTVHRPQTTATVRREDVGSRTNSNVLRHAYRQAGPDIQRPTDSVRSELRLLTEAQIAEGVREVLVTELGVNPEQLAPEALLIEELGMESINFFAIHIALETRFGFEISDELAEKWMTVGDISRSVIASQPSEQPALTSQLQARVTTTYTPTPAPKPAAISLTPGASSSELKRSVPPAKNQGDGPEQSRRAEVRGGHWVQLQTRPQSALRLTYPEGVKLLKRMLAEGKAYELKADLGHPEGDGSYRITLQEGQIYKLPSTVVELGMKKEEPTLLRPGRNAFFVIEARNGLVKLMDADPNDFNASIKKMPFVTANKLPSQAPTYRVGDAIKVDETTQLRVVDFQATAKARLREIKNGTPTQNYWWAVPEGTLYKGQVQFVSVDSTAKTLSAIVKRAEVRTARKETSLIPRLYQFIQEARKVSRNDRGFFVFGSKFNLALQVSPVSVQYSVLSPKGEVWSSGRLRRPANKTEAGLFDVLENLLADRAKTQTAQFESLESQHLAVIERTFPVKPEFPPLQPEDFADMKREQAQRAEVRFTPNVLSNQKPVTRNQNPNLATGNGSTSLTILSLSKDWQLVTRSEAAGLQVTAGRLAPIQTGILPAGYRVPSRSEIRLSVLAAASRVGLDANVVPGVTAQFAFDQGGLLAMPGIFGDRPAVIMLDSKRSEVRQKQLQAVAEVNELRGLGRQPYLTATTALEFAEKLAALRDRSEVRERRPGQVLLYTPDDSLDQVDEIKKAANLSRSELRLINAAQFRSLMNTADIAQSTLSEFVSRLLSASREAVGRSA